MRRRVAARLLPFLLLWPASQAGAWTDATRLRMLDDALKVSPPALRAMLERHDRDLRRGMLDPSKREGEEVHYQHPDGRRGMGASGVARLEADIRGMLRGRRPLRHVAYSMGSLAHLVADVEFPLNASDDDRREALYREAYRRYIETMLPKIPFVLDRDPPALLTAGDLRGFMMDRARDAALNYAPIGPAFNDDGTPRSRDALDERSLPFGVAALSYSHAASSIAWVWLHLWRSLNGDLRGTPALELPPAERARLPEPPASPQRRRTNRAGPPERPAPSGAPSPPPAPEETSP